MAMLASYSYSSSNRDEFDKTSLSRLARGKATRQLSPELLRSHQKVATTVGSLGEMKANSKTKDFKSSIEERTLKLVRSRIPLPKDFVSTIGSNMVECLVKYSLHFNNIGRISHGELHGFII